MGRRRHTLEQIIRTRAEGQKLLAGGMDVEGMCRQFEIAESTWARWLAQYGGMKADDAKRLKELEEMLTVRRMGIDGTLARTLVCMNMIESMIAIARTTTRNVKRWRNEGDMRRRWCAAGLLEAERKFRRVRGHKQMPHLVAALGHHTERVTPTCNTQLAA